MKRISALLALCSVVFIGLAGYSYTQASSSYSTKKDPALASKKRDQQDQTRDHHHAGESLLRFVLRDLPARRRHTHE